MKTILTIFVAAVFSLSAHAQAGLAVGRLFESNKKLQSPTTETIITGDALKGTGINIYHSLTIQGDTEMAQRMSEAVTADASAAESREMKYEQGKIYFAQLTMKPKGAKNRYILYLDNTLKGGNNVLLLYIEGKASLQQIKELINITKNSAQK